MNYLYTEYLETLLLLKKTKMESTNPYEDNLYKEIIQLSYWIKKTYNE